MSRLVVVGDVLLDRDVEGDVERLSPDAPVPVVERTSERARPGGAGLAAALAARDGHDVVLVAAVADDAAGGELRTAVADAGVELVDLGLAGTTPEKIRVRGGGLPLLRLDRCGDPPGAVGAAGAAAADAIADAEAILVADYGRGLAREPALRSVMASVSAPLVWDPHPLGPAPIRGAALVTPNAREAERFAPRAAREGRQHVTEAAIARARELLQHWEALAVCVTLGAGGAVLVAGRGAPVAVHAEPAMHGDPCGAGDRFASSATGLMAQCADPVAAVRGAVAAAAQFVAAGGAGAAGREPAPVLAPNRSAEEVVERTRAAGGTVVATGGCFDLVHAGHVHMLRAARRLGDSLVVCLNSDESVRRLKGPGRPLTPQADRAGVLRALESVDAVVVFDEPTPEAVLARLRPHIFAKGGDYAGVELPEARTMRAWGGEVVVLPYVDGISTTRLIAQAGGSHAA